MPRQSYLPCGLAATGGAVARGRPFAPLRACTALRLPVVCRASNLTYRQMYRQVVQPIDREGVCKLFNVLHVVLDQLHIICVYHCMAILIFVAILMLTLIYVAIYISDFFVHLHGAYQVQMYLCISLCGYLIK
jgi:hypothetical protein